jgi:hypothetical protein
VSECETKRVPLNPRVPEIELLSFLDRNNDVFVWKTSDLTGVSRDIIEHKLQVDHFMKPRKQRLCRMSDEKVAAAKAEV